jgi:hypothetical protein
VAVSGAEVAMAPCFIHGGVFGFDPEAVCSVLVDPETGRPPDVGPDGQAITPDPEAVQRSVRKPVCDDCMERANRARVAAGQAPVELARDRLRRSWP